MTYLSKTDRFIEKKNNLYENKSFSLRIFERHQL